jgi:peptidyl-prolyl cis-trans isomerase C
MKILKLPIVLLILLPACSFTEWFKKNTECSNCCYTPSSSHNSDNTTAVISFADKPIVTAKDYEKSLELLASAQPGFQEMLPLMATEQQEQIHEQIADHLANERLIQQWVIDNKIDQTPEFKENARQVHEAVERDLAVRAFENHLTPRLHITDEEAHTFYDENKSKLPIFKHPQFIAHVGGIKAQSISAANEKDAKDLLEQAKKEGFSTAASNAKKSVTDLGLVNTHSTTVDADIRTKISEAKTIPGIIIAKNSKNKWSVINLIEQKPIEYAPFEQVADKIKQVLMRDKFTELYKKEMDTLKAKYNVSINKEYLKKQVKVAAMPEEVASPESKTPQPTPKTSTSAMAA